MDYIINVAKLDEDAIKLSGSSFAYSGEEKTPLKKVVLSGRTLEEEQDYTVSYSKNVNIGTATVTVEGKGNYTGTVKKTFKIVAKEGKVYTVGSYKYKITDSSAVAFVGLKSTNTTKVTIPNTVKIGGKSFKVTSIGAKALYKKTKVTSIKISANVTKIGDKAFTGCKALKSITIPSKVTTIGKETFHSCSKLSTITIKTTKLKSVGKNAFKGIYSTARIKVPAKKLAAYKNLLKGKGQGSKVKITK